MINNNNLLYFLNYLFRNQLLIIFNLEYLDIMESKYFHT